MKNIINKYAAAISVIIGVLVTFVFVCLAVPPTPPTVNITGNAATATALAANGANCSAGYAPLGVDASGAVESCTQYQAYDADLTTWAGVTPGANVTTVLATPTSANLANAITDETGSGVLVFATSPTLVTPALGTPASGTLTNCTGLPQAGVTGLTTTDGPTFDHLHLTAGQVGFPASQSASADANTLDDYEEGTWTPVYEGSTGSIGSTAYGTVAGTYTKIGRMVTVNGYLTLTNNGDWTGNVRITGLPFISASYSVGAVMMYQVTYDGYAVVSIDPVAQYATIYITKTASNWALLGCAGVADNSIFLFTLTYFV